MFFFRGNTCRSRCRCKAVCWKLTIIKKTKYEFKMIYGTPANHVSELNDPNCWTIFYWRRSKKCWPRFGTRYTEMIFSNNTAFVLKNRHKRVDWHNNNNTSKMFVSMRHTLTIQDRQYYYLGTAIEGQINVMYWNEPYHK